MPRRAISRVAQAYRTLENDSGPKVLPPPVTRMPAVLPFRSEAAMLITSSEQSVVHGQAGRGFESVRQAFVENFSRRHELGGACCVYYRGEKVVDLWGGVRDKQTGAPWEERTMCIVHSATGGLAAMPLAIAHSRGWLDYDERVATYWPEFAAHGKDRITVRQLLAHQAGLAALDEHLDRDLVATPDRLASVLARQQPTCEPGTRQAYHALTLGFHEAELVRRVDPFHRSLGRVFEDEIATPLGLDFYIRLPESIPNARFATTARPRTMNWLRGYPGRFTLDTLAHPTSIHRALDPAAAMTHDARHVYARNLEVPSSGGVGTARAMALAYSMFATGGRALGLRKDTIDLLAAPAMPCARGFYDDVLKLDVPFSLGFMKPSRGLPFGNSSSFGSAGEGGAMAFADPTARVGYAYVTSQMGRPLTTDPRDRALRAALYSAITTA